jgi:hypothetical protein
VSRCRSVQSTELLDSHRTSRSEHHFRARAIVSITYKPAPSGGPFARINRSRKCENRATPEGLNSPERYLLPKDRLDSLSLAPLCSWENREHLLRRGFVLRPDESEFHRACSGVSGRTMITACANPACNAPFFYFRSGKIFVLEANGVGSKLDSQGRGIEHFWLCGECAPAMHLMRTTDGAVRICPCPPPSDPRVALKRPDVSNPSFSSVSRHC